MKKCLLSLFAIFLAFSPLNAEESIDPTKKAISYNRSGRLGNCLISYLCAKWIAHKHNLPFLYVPFDMSEQFAFHKMEKNFRKTWGPKFKQTKDINDLAMIDSMPDSTLILANFFKVNKDLPANKEWSFRMFWHDPEFRAFASNLLKPVDSIKTLELPKNTTNVLLHVRTGGGFDDRTMQLNYPTKFPPFSFYVKSLETMSQELGSIPLNVFIMTDDLNPEGLAKQFRTALAHLPNITFDYRKGASGPFNNVLEDFFSVPKFDCLIRGNSTFTVAASVLGHFKMVIRVAKAHVENGEVVIDSVEVRKDV